MTVCEVRMWLKPAERPATRLFDSTEAAADFNEAALQALQDFELGITGPVLLA